jgi:hypothetical protein
MRSTVIFLAGALAGVGALAVTSTLLEPSAPPAARLEAGPTPRLPAADDGPARDIGLPRDLSPQRAAATREIEPSEPSPEWTALVGEMLETEVARRRDEKLTADKKQRLVAELARLREASLSLQRAPAEPDDPAELRDRLTQTLALVQADQAFRKELGLGVSEFLQGANPGAIEEVPPAPVER